MRKPNTIQPDYAYGDSKRLDGRDDAQSRFDSGQVYVAFHKPCGFSCSHAISEAPIIDTLLPGSLRGIGLQSIGRLDRDTSGLLILTTDGALIHRLAQPASKVEKQYRIGFRGVLPDDAVERCEAGLLIEGYATATQPAQLVVSRLARSQSAGREEQLGEASLTLREGRHHQVRRMFRAMRVRVVQLHRARIGGYSLPDTLAPGECVALDPAALGALDASVPAASVC